MFYSEINRKIIINSAHYLKAFIIILLSDVSRFVKSGWRLQLNVMPQKNYTYESENRELRSLIREIIKYVFSFAIREYA